MDQLSRKISIFSSVHLVLSITAGQVSKQQQTNTNLEDEGKWQGFDHISFTNARQEH